MRRWSNNTPSSAHGDMSNRPSGARQRRCCAAKRHETQAPAKPPDRRIFTVSQPRRSLRVGNRDGDPYGRASDRAGCWGDGLQTDHSLIHLSKARAASTPPGTAGRSLSIQTVGRRSAVHVACRHHRRPVDARPLRIARRLAVKTPGPNTLSPHTPTVMQPPRERRGWDDHGRGFEGVDWVC